MEEITEKSGLDHQLCRIAQLVRDVEAADEVMFEMERLEDVLRLRTIVENVRHALWACEAGSISPQLSPDPASFIAARPSSCTTQVSRDRWGEKKSAASWVATGVAVINLLTNLLIKFLGC